MNEQEIKTGSYSNFDTGINTISEFNSTLDEEMQKIKTYQTKLDDENVFAGDICDSCVEGFTSLMNKLNIDKENYSTISSYLEQCKAKYESADDKAKALYLAIKDNGKLEITEGLSAGAYVNNNCPKYQADFINAILPYAIDLYNTKGILPSLTLAQACKESAFGTARPGNGHNIFGIKASGWSGKTANARTGEQTTTGQTYYINADFRDYDSYEAAVHDYGEVLSLERYDAVRNAKDYKEAAHAVKAGGYATGVNYDNSLITDYIEAYNLNQWDPVR